MLIVIALLFAVIWMPDKGDYLLIAVYSISGCGLVGMKIGKWIDL